MTSGAPGAPDQGGQTVPRPRAFSLTGHDSHIRPTAEFIAHCIDNEILLMILPHSSHLTQPLDVGVFGALKKHMAAELYPLMRTGVARIQKVEWLTAFVAAHEKALSTKNILGGFRGTDIILGSSTSVRSDRFWTAFGPTRRPALRNRNILSNLSWWLRAAL